MLLTLSQTFIHLAALMASMLSLLFSPSAHITIMLGTSGLCLFPKATSASW